MNYEKKYGSPFPIIEVSLAANEAICIEPGTMMYSDPAISLHHTTNAHRQKMTGGKRISRFGSANKILAIVQASQPARVAVAPCKPGDLIELHCDTAQNEQWKIIGGAFLACDMGVSFEVVQGGFGASFGALFSNNLPMIILQTSGNGSCIVDSCGNLQRINLNGTRSINVDSAHLVAWSAGLQYKVFQQRSNIRGVVVREWVAQFSGHGSVIMQSNSR